jgi:hypothetical protein
MVRASATSFLFWFRIVAGSVLCTGSALLFLSTSGAEQVSTGRSFAESQGAGVPSGAGKHEARAHPGQQVGSMQQMTAAELTDYLARTPATRSTFVAAWTPVAGATGYRLDVSRDSTFTNFVPGYRDLDVGNVTGKAVTGLAPGTIYYYRVRSYGQSGAGASTDAASVMTVATTGLIIQPTFDTSITGDPNSAAIQAAITRAIAIYENLYGDPMIAKIFFRYSTTNPDGTPIGVNGPVALSLFGLSIQPWSTYITQLRADATSANDTTANNSLPANALATSLAVSTANGRALGFNTPTTTFPNGTFGTGGPYDGIVTLNSNYPFQFTRPAVANRYDTQEFVEHEIDEVIGLGSYLDCTYCQNNNAWRPQDLFSWSAPGVRNTNTSGSRYFSINSGGSSIVSFNQEANGDHGDWDSPFCPQPTPRVQNAFNCSGQSSDVAATSAEGINLDVIGYDVGAQTRFDFNRDGKPDFVLLNSSGGQTAIWYMNNNVYVSGALAKTIPAGWELIDIADFNGDGKQDYLLFNPTSLRTAIYYMNNNIYVSYVYGPTLPAGWTLVGAADFNNDGKPDYILYNPATLHTMIWYMNNNVYLSAAAGPTLFAGWKFIGAADFNRDGKNDYLLFDQSTHQTAIWYLNGVTRTGSAYGPIIGGGYTLVGTADFNGDGKTDFVLFNPTTRQTALWYLNNNVMTGSAYGPVVTPGWVLKAP